MSRYQKHATFEGRILCLGFGSIGQGILPLILRHLDMDPRRISIVTADERGLDVAREHDVDITIERLNRRNYRKLLQSRLSAGDLLLNLTVDVSSVALIEVCQKLGVLYVDTCIEPWPGGYTNPKLSGSERSNYTLRESARALKAKYPDGHTAVVGHGANPGLVSHFVKQALLNIARDTRLKHQPPASREDWADLAHRLGVKVIHIAERDTQVAATPKEPGEFVNTWSIDGFIGEGCQPAELGWGTHEKKLPKDAGRHSFGPRCAIYLNRPGASVRVRTWTPLEGPFHGFLITHNESISIADYYSVRNGRGKVTYRPTVHYAYHPCDDAVLSMHELNGKNYVPQKRQRLLSAEDIIEGRDELGVLLMGHKKNAYWYGSQLSNAETRALVNHNNATGLQVTITALAGMIWAIENPRRSICDADELDHDRILEICMPYLGEVVGVYSKWTPLQGRESLFPEDLDHSDPWQFKNIRVI